MMTATWADVREILLPLAGVEEGTSFGTRAFRVRRKLVARLREDGDTLVVLQVEDIEKEMLIATQPGVYYTTDHYRGHPSVLVRLSMIDGEELRERLTESCRRASSAQAAARSTTTSRSGNRSHQPRAVKGSPEGK